LNEVNSLFAEFPVPIIFLRVANDFEPLCLELEAQPQIIFLAVRCDDHEARRDLGQCTTRQPNNLSGFERRVVLARGTVLYECFELVVISLLGRKELLFRERQNYVRRNTKKRTASMTESVVSVVAET
jgi:hypothetical protein